jgi:hypothetical protein
VGFARERYALPETVERPDGEVVTQPFPPREWTHWAAIDGGVRDPWCVLWAARAPDRRVFVYREVYEAGVEVPEQARRVRAITQRAGVRLERIQADPAMFTTRANLTWSDAQKYDEGGVPLTRGTNAREPGWHRVRELLGPLDDGYPALVVLAAEDGRLTAPNLCRTLPLMTADPDAPEDVEDGQEDHAADCLRYLVMPASVPDVSRRGKDVIATMGDEDTEALLDTYRRDGDSGAQYVWPGGGVASGWR